MNYIYLFLFFYTYTFIYREKHTYIDAYIYIVQR
jgi:hypothetical protein